MSAGATSARDLTVDAAAAAPAGYPFARDMVEAGRQGYVADRWCNLDGSCSPIRDHLHEVSMPTSQAASAGHMTGKGA